MEIQPFNYAFHDSFQKYKIQGILQQTKNQNPRLAFNFQPNEHYLVPKRIKREENHQFTQTSFPQLNIKNGFDSKRKVVQYFKESKKRTKTDQMQSKEINDDNDLRKYEEYQQFYLQKDQYMKKNEKKKKQKIEKLDQYKKELQQAKSKLYQKSLKSNNLKRQNNNDINQVQNQQRPPNEAYYRYCRMVHQTTISEQDLIPQGSKYRKCPWTHNFSQTLQTMLANSAITKDDYTKIQIVAYILNNQLEYVKMKKVFGIDHHDNPVQIAKKPCYEGLQRLRDLNHEQGFFKKSDFKNKVTMRKVGGKFLLTLRSKNRPQIQFLRDITFRVYLSLFNFKTEVTKDQLKQAFKIYMSLYRQIESRQNKNN